jgi:hypothetical protein
MEPRGWHKEAEMMDNLEKFRRLGAMVELPGGAEGIRVSIQYVPRLTGLSWQARESALQAEFAKLSSQLAASSAEIVPQSLSVSGQTIKVVLPTDAYDRLPGELDPAVFRIDAIIDRDVELGGAGGR